MTAFFKVESLKKLILLLVLSFTLFDVDVSTAIEKHALSWGNKVIIHTQ